VTLFGLPKVLQYKSRSGRDVQHRRAQLRQLLAHLEGLRDAPVPFDVGSSARWAEIRSQVDGATRKVDLERVEDAVDAVVCAYVGLYAVAAPDRVRVLGDVERGYILTPVTPELAHRVDADRVSDQVSDQVREADRS
jgi:predicted RNase H-like nuclease